MKEVDDQFALEQGLVDEMYDHLGRKLAEAQTARGRATTSQVASTSDLFTRDAELSRLQGVERALAMAAESLCFGRIDGVDGGWLHIGRTGLAATDGDQLLVDWRAEAARPFYEATPAAPLGLRRRRHIRLANHQVTAVSDEILDGSPPTAQDRVGDSPLSDALQTARTGRMRQAVATLQAEQDAIIRAANRGITVVDGGPGTGKTIVALHRAAYVLYAFPALARRGVMVFGPNRRFLDYISDVLPSLGENDVSLATLADLTGIEPSMAEPDGVAQLKGRAEVAVALRRWVRERQPSGDETLEVTVGSDRMVLPCKVVSEAHRLATKDGLAHNQARAAFVELVVEELIRSMEAATAAALMQMDADVSASLAVDLDQAVAKDLRALGLDDQVETQVDPEIDWEAMHERLLEDPSVDLSVERVWPRLDSRQVLDGLLADRTALARVVPELELTDANLAGVPDRTSGQLSAADLPLLDEVRTLIDGPPERLFGHVVVDEAQELSEMAWRVLMRRCPTRSLTVVGDFAQAGSATTVRSWSQALAPFSSSQFSHHTLTVNYRTTAEILEAAAPVLERIAPDQVSCRSLRRGEKPRYVSVASEELVNLVCDLVDQTTKVHCAELIGVVAPPQHVLRLSNALKGTDARVVAAADARGLEFDSVVVVDPTAIEAARLSGINDLYVAMTRATKRIVTVVPTPST